MSDRFVEAHRRARRGEPPWCEEKRTPRCSNEHCRKGLVSLAVLVLPVEVEVPAEAPRDSSGPQVTIDVLGGGGSYAIIPRDCQGQQVAPAIGVPYREAAWAFGVEDPPWRVGVRMGRLWIDHQEGARETTWVNPHVALGWSHLGFGAGPFVGASDLPRIVDPVNPIPYRAAPPLSAHLWAGARAVNLRLSVMESDPLLSGGGYVRYGLRIVPRDRFDLFAGVSAGPFDEKGLFASLDVPVHERVSILTRIRVGSSAGERETGFALGLRWWAKRLPAGRGGAG
jgi:hypothetical protein